MSPRTEQATLVVLIAMLASCGHGGAEGRSSVQKAAVNAEPVTALFWVKRTPARSPPERAHCALAYDSARNRTVLFGGMDNTKQYSDTWEWDGTNWTERSPSPAPLPRYYPVMAYDSARRRTVLFGGSNDNIGHLGDTWEWDGTTWANRTPASSPSQNSQPMVFDSARGKTVLFGGSGQNTWEWDGVNWVDRTPPGSPSRTGHAMAYDPVRRRTVLFGGSSVGGLDLGDTWEWNGTTWQQMTPSQGPGLRRLHKAVYHSLLRQTVFIGGDDGSDTWAWDGTTWTQLSVSGNPGFYIAGIVYDSSRERIVLYNGLTWEFGFFRTVGSDCSNDDQCATQHCSDGVCCDTRCDGGCDVCRASLGANTDGACVALPSGHPGSPACASPFQCNGTSPACPTSCSSDSDCISTTYCQTSTHGCLAKLPLGAPCPDGYSSCQSAACLNGICSACVADTHCSASQYCSTSGQCLEKLAAGAPCPAGDHSCVSAFCTDGVCCNDRCNGFCLACTASLKGSGTDGACGPIAAETDPEGDCPTDPGYPASCKADGLCDGNGACRLYAVADTACASASCSGGALTTATCNGAGNCLARTNSCPGNLACASPGECAAGCTTDGDCVAGFACDSAGQCTSSAGVATCKDDRTALDSHGVPSSCAPYRCANGACLRECVSVDDCVSSAVCDDARHCVAPSSAAGSEEGCACRAVSSRRGAPHGVFVLGVLTALLGLGRRRRDRAERS